ncbi:MAG TPA: hypothetical protein VHA13_02625, partial [Gammaproteobacteria bacterium]|nr:hypothetical protein [Gammaproteobacteria bacterium]
HATQQTEAINSKKGQNKPKDKDNFTDLSSISDSSPTPTQPLHDKNGSSDKYKHGGATKLDAVRHNGKGNFSLDINGSNKKGVLQELSEKYPQAVFSLSNNDGIKVSPKKPKDQSSFEDLKGVIKSISEDYGKSLKGLDSITLKSKSSKIDMEPKDTAGLKNQAQTNQQPQVSNQAQASQQTSGIQLDSFRASSSFREAKVYMSFSEMGNSLSGQSSKNMKDKVQQYVNDYVKNFNEKNPDAAKSGKPLEIEVKETKKGLSINMKNHPQVKSNEGKIHLLSSIVSRVNAEHNKSMPQKDFASKFPAAVDKAKNKVNFKAIKFNKKDGTFQTKVGKDKVALNDNQIKGIEKKLNDKFGKDGSKFSIKNDGNKSEIAVNGKKLSELGKDDAAGRNSIKNAEKYLAKKSGGSANKAIKAEQISIKMK